MEKVLVVCLFVCCLLAGKKQQAGLEPALVEFHICHRQCLPECPKPRQEAPTSHPALSMSLVPRKSLDSHFPGHGEPTDHHPDLCPLAQWMSQRSVGLCHLSKKDGEHGPVARCWGAIRMSLGPGSDRKGRTGREAVDRWAARAL